jgi:hypothetical protein
MRSTRAELDYMHANPTYAKKWEKRANRKIKKYLKKRRSKRPWWVI